MKIINYTENINTQDRELPSYFSHYYADENPLFFDIETTGFAALNTTLYLIGVLWYEDGQIKIRQWFNDDGKSEEELITAFETFCSHFTMLIHFNGAGFDLPYLKQKAQHLHIDFTVDSRLHQLDIFKEIRNFKTIFALDNMKQVTIEQYLGIIRTDTYSGGDLINIYQRFVARPDTEKEQLLLLHNHDDLLGMPQISGILNYTAFFNRLAAEDLEILSIKPDESNDKLIIIFQYPDYAFLPNRILCSKDSLFLNASECKATLQIPVIHDTLKHYFSDYKNYFYLPAEDMAIHKSVASFVENSNKEKAKKSTCYTKKTDAFIPCHNTDNISAFQYDIVDKKIYQSLDTLTNDNEYVLTYILQCLKTFN